MWIRAEKEKGVDYWLELADEARGTEEDEEEEEEEDEEWETGVPTLGSNSPMRSS